MPRFLAKLTLSVAMGLLPLVIVETALRLHELGVPPARFVVHGDGDRQIVETAAYDPSPRLPARLNHQSFPLAKQPGALRVVCFGGSSVYGYPYGPKGTFPNLLQAILQQALPSRPVEVINAGFTGGDSARVLQLMHEALPFGADAWVVYSGHNEFLHYDYPDEYDVLHGYNSRAQAPLAAQLEEALSDLRLWRWARGTPGGRALADALGSALGRDSRGRSGRLGRETEEASYRSFEANLEDMAQLARDHGVRLLLSTVAGNVRTLAPIGSGDPPSLPAADLLRLRTTVEAARDALARGQPQRALAALDEARAVAADEADVHFLSGTARLDAGDPAGARRDFEHALERDPRRHRATPRINTIVRAVAAREQVPLVDIAETLAARAPAGICGNESFVDHVHPTMPALVAIAREIARTMAGAGMFPPQALQNVATDDELLQRTGMGEADWRRALSRLALSAAGGGNREQAARLFRQAAERFDDGEDPRGIERSYLLALAAFSAGSGDEARRLLDRAALDDPARYRELQLRFRQLPIDAPSEPTPR